MTALLPDERLHGIVAGFAPVGAVVDARPHGSGHINDTYALTCDRTGRRSRYVLQRLNDRVFRDPDALMDNVARVLSHARRRLGDAPDAMRRVLTLVPAADGSPCVRDEDGAVWRMYHFIEQAHTVDLVTSPRHAEAAARAFGAYQRLLTDLPGTRLHETIPRFHHTPDRFAACLAAIEADTHGRAHEAADAIAFALARHALAGVLVEAHARGEIPERVTHNDTKINNVMFDDTTGEGLCVVDLDTTMPGLAPYDFGDMVRTATNTAAEDERDLARVGSRLDLFEALACGYLAAAGSFLNATEVALLPAAGRVMTFEQGVRFLTDYLLGDPYYRVHRPGQNLDRARAQFALLASLEAQRDAQERLVARHARGG